MAGKFFAFGGGAVTCFMFCKQLGSLFGSAIVPSAGTNTPTARDVGVGGYNDEATLFWSSNETLGDLHGLRVETNGLVDDTSAIFKFANGESVPGELFNYTGTPTEGIAYGNFSINGANGQWITVNLNAQNETADIFNWLYEATEDGFINATEFQQVLPYLHDEV